MKIKARISELFLAVIRAYFVGRTVHWMTSLGGQPIHRGEGKVVSGRIDRDMNRNPVGMTFFWSMPGRPIHELKRFPLWSIKRDKTLGWVFYDG